MDTLFDLPRTKTKHPAKYTDALLSQFVRMTYGCKKILDPFGGTGKIFFLNHWYPDVEIRAIELEPEWARLSPHTIIGNALALPFVDNYFDCICTSPTYGNDMAIESNPEKWNSQWITFRYADALGRKLHPENSGHFKWGEPYRQFHIRAWRETTRVLRNNGCFILNIKNHIRHGAVVPVTEWHTETLSQLGYEVIERIDVKCPGISYGLNSEKRIEYESVIKFILSDKSK